LSSVFLRGRSAARALRKSKALTALLFVTVTVASYAAHFTERPITSALVYLMGVMVIGATRGLRSGLIAAVVASLIYSGLIRNPAFQFVPTSLDYYVPLFGFNFAALLSGMLAGRLKDRAELAEESRNQLDLLLQFSSKLQKAVRIEDVAQALYSTVSPDVIRDGIRPYLNEHIEEPERGAVLKVLDMESPADLIGMPADTYRLAVQDIDLPAFVDLLSMAVDRCGLLEDRAESQARLRSEDLKTTILSSLSHDLRTPIAAISASATSLKRFGDALSPGVREQMLDTIEHQCTRLDQFTAKLLSFGRLQGGVAALQSEPADVAELLGKAIATARANGPDRLLNKQWADKPLIVMANPAMLEQVFFNILENAFSYTPPECAIAVIAEAHEGHASVVIGDNGPGVAAESLDHIFEPFFRSDQSKHTTGQGLGLFIAKGFVEAFGGTIAACSPHSAGPGLEIAITLPLAKDILEIEADG
jgi:two-component system sensor histidine kinase KdpD